MTSNGIESPIVLRSSYGFLLGIEKTFYPEDTIFYINSKEQPFLSVEDCDYSFSISPAKLFSCFHKNTAIAWCIKPHRTILIDILTLKNDSENEYINSNAVQSFFMITNKICEYASYKDALSLAQNKLKNTKDIEFEDINIKFRRIIRK